MHVHNHDPQQGSKHFAERLGRTYGHVVAMNDKQGTAVLQSGHIMECLRCSYVSLDRLP